MLVLSLLKNILEASFKPEQIHSLLNNGASDMAVDLKMSIMKPLGAKWLMEMYDPESSLIDAF